MDGAAVIGGAVFCYGDFILGSGYGSDFLSNGNCKKNCIY